MEIDHPNNIARTISDLSWPIVPFRLSTMFIRSAFRVFNDVSAEVFCKEWSKSDREKRG